MPFAFMGADIVYLARRGSYTVCPKKVVTRFNFLAIRDKWKV